MKKIAIAFTALAMVIGPVAVMAAKGGSNGGVSAGAASQSGSQSASISGAGASSGSSLTLNTYNAGETRSVNSTNSSSYNRSYNTSNNTNRSVAEGGYNNTNQVKYSGSYSISNVPGVVAPALTTTLTETCMGSTSIGGAGVGFGVSFGTTWRDTACVRRLDARQLLALGHSDAATELMCDSEAVKGAFRRVGRPCAEDGATIVAAPRPEPRSAEYGMTRVASAPSGGVDAYRRAMSQCGDDNYSSCMREAKKHLN